LGTNDIPFAKKGDYTIRFCCLSQIYYDRRQVTPVTCVSPVNLEKPFQLATPWIFKAKHPPSVLYV